jgi:hypothetical protein
LKFSAFKFPVSRENCFNPEGHSGHPRLHAVVGSMLNEMGIPQGFADLKKREK